MKRHFEELLSEGCMSPKKSRKTFGIVPKKVKNPFLMVKSVGQLADKGSFWNCFFMPTLPIYREDERVDFYEMF